MIHILLSTYNGTRYLGEQLDSIIAQSYTDWRLFVRDDGSLDDTLRILTEYAGKDERIKLLKDGENLGACRSFERLMMQCGGADYYAFADQDDVWKPEKLAICVEAMRQQEGLHPHKPVVVHTDLQVVDEKMHEIAPSFWQYSNIRPDLLDSRKYYLAICNSVTGCAMLFNEAARAAALPFPPAAYMHDAWIALKTLLSGGCLIPIHLTPIAYRQHGDNVLGAVEYKVLGRSVSRRRYEAHISYARAKGYVYRNKVQFLIWKMIYFIHRQWYTRCHE